MKEQIKHTPGPWCLGDPKRREFTRAGEWYECQVHVGSGGQRGNSIATVYLGGAGATSLRKEEVLANARLISAAPSLLGACNDSINYNGGPIDGVDGEYVMVKREHFDAIVEAVRKAEGES